MQDRPGPFTLREGAAVLGVSLNTLRRRIAAGQVRAERVERAQGFVWQVYLDGAAPSQDGANGTVQRDGAVTVQHPPTALMQAEAMAAYTRSLLEPLVTHVAALETTVREQAETIGRQAAELEQLRAPQQPQVGSGGQSPGSRPVIAWAWLVLALVILLALVVGQPGWVR